MRHQQISALAAATFVVAILSGTALAADGHVTYLEAAGPGDRPMVLAGSDRGVVFVGADNEMFRAFHHSQSASDGVEQPYLWVEDIDADGRSEYVGAGSPSFVIDDNGDPMWGVLDGCNQYFLADFIDDRNKEIFCRGPRAMKVWSYDGQLYYEWEGRGYSITTCFADDFDGDRKHEVACNLTSGNHLFFDLDYMEPEEREGVAPEVINRGGVDTSGVAGVAAGTAELDVDGQAVTLAFAGGAVSLTVGGSPVGSAHVGGTGIYSAIAADLDGDGTSSIYVGGDDAVHIISPSAQLIASVPANPDRASRESRVEVRSATANGLEQSDRETIGALVGGEVGSFVSCYDRAMGSDQFTRVGQMLWELTISDSGRVTSATKRHSNVRSISLESCVEDVLEDIRFSPATDGTGSASITLDFQFVDRP